MDNTGDLIQALRPVLAQLDRLGVRYCVGGSIASSLHGAGRSTLDVDLAAELNETTALTLARGLEREFYVSQVGVRDAVRRKACFNLIHLGTSFKVDIFVSKDRPFDHSVLNRATLVSLDDNDTLSARITSAEDIILLKLEWYRLGNETSERQWDDVTRVGKVYGERLDQLYLRQWAKELGVADLLERLLENIGRQ